MIFWCHQYPIFIFHFTINLFQLLSPLLVKLCFQPLFKPLLTFCLRHEPLAEIVRGTTFPARPANIRICCLNCHLWSLLVLGRWLGAALRGSPRFRTPPPFPTHLRQNIPLFLHSASLSKRSFFYYFTIHAQTIADSRQTYPTFPILIVAVRFTSQLRLLIPLAMIFVNSQLISSRQWIVQSLV